jgi:hypothetical protein
MKTQSDIVRIAVNCFIFNITQTAAGVRARAAVEELHRQHAAFHERAKQICS